MLKPDPFLPSLQNLVAAGCLLSGNREADAIRFAGRGGIIAIPYQHTGGWSAQTSFLRSVAVCLQEAALLQGGRVVVLNLSGPEGARAVAGDLRNLMVPADPAIWYRTGGPQQILEELGAHCLISLFEPPPENLSGIGVVGWIPDFQHFRLPGFFSPAELRSRDEAFHSIIQRSDRLLLSSRDVEKDCLEFDPGAQGKTRVHPFPSGLILETQPANASRGVVQKYGLPDKFVLVANQFWAHKNHSIVIRALQELMRQGLPIPLVLTGLPADSRDPTNRVVSQILQEIATGGLHQTTFVLGQVPYADLVNLLQAAALILQPSKFEGWSTVVQDAKALGRPVLCSRLSVHQEQVPDALGFFDPEDPGELAGILRNCWSALPAGPDPSGAKAALAAEKQFALDYGAALWRTCLEAADVRANSGKYGVASRGI